jgi:hypothetical protein
MKQRVKVSLVGCVIGTLALGLILASCGKRAAQGTGRAGSPQDSVHVTVGLNEGSYAIGEPMIMKLTARNTTGRMLRLTFPTAQRFDFIVRQGKQVIWQWSNGKMFAQVIGRLSVGPGDSVSYEYRWDQKLSDGSNPDLGPYTIQGVLTTLPKVTSSEMRFGIAD